MSNHSTRNKTILVIDDKADVRDSLSLLLDALGYEVYLAADGFSGLAKAQASLPDFILCDLSLPCFDGYQIAQALRADERLKATCLIALSGFVQPEVVAKAKQAGFAFHLAKPLDLDLLQTILARPG